MTPRERLLLDLTIFVVVIGAANPVVTGLSFHEWLGFVLVVPALVHLVVNWEWVLRVAAGFFGRARAASRINLVVDTGLFGSLIAVTVSGILVIPGLAASMGLSASGEWHAVHLAASDLIVAFSLAHFALHWRWVTNVARRWVAPTSPPALAPRYSPAGSAGAATARTSQHMTAKNPAGRVRTYGR